MGCDYQGRLYEDFYWVIVHEERRDDWSAVIVTLKKHFNQYPESLRKEGFPEDCLSSASEGNFLEVLNMGANGGYFGKICFYSQLPLKQTRWDRHFVSVGQRLVVSFIQIAALCLCV